MRHDAFRKNLVADLIGIALTAATMYGLPAEQGWVMLTGNTSPKALPEYDRGPVPGSQPMFQMQLTERMSMQGQEELASPDDHRFLTPEQYADRFGWKRADVEQLKAWLVSQGFRVDHVARARNVIFFSGTAEHVEQAFRVRIDRFVVDGETHFANTTDPSVPAELAPLIQSVGGLDDFQPGAEVTGGA